MQIADLFYSIRGEGFEQLESKINRTSNKFAGVGTALTDGVTKPILKMGLGIIKTTMTFDQEMSKVKAVTGATGDEFTDLRDLAIDMGSKTDKSATEAAEAIGYMGLAGWDTKDIMKGLPSVLDLSSASNLDLATTSDLVTDSMAAFGLTVDDLAHYTDVAAAAQANSNMTTQQFLEAMVAGGGTARMYNMTLEETAAIYGILANRGFKGAEAGNALTSILANLTAKGGQSGKAMKELNIELYDSKGNFRGMTPILKDLNKKFAGMSKEQKNSYIQMIAGKTRTKEFNAMLNGTKEELDGLTDKLINSDGALSEMAETMRDNFGGQITKIKSKLEAVAISIGDRLTPYLEIAAKWLQKLVDWFYKLPGPVKDVIIIIALVVAAIGPIILAFSGIIIVIGGVITSLGVIIGAVGALISGLGLLLIPIGLIAGAFVVLTGVLAAVGISYLLDKFGSIQGIFKAIQSFIIESLVPAFKYLTSGEGLGKVNESAFITKERLKSIRNAMLAIKSFILESLIPALIYLATGEGLGKVNENAIITKGRLTAIRSIMVKIYSFIVDTLVPALIYLATGKGLGKVNEGSTKLRNSLKKLRQHMIDLKNYIKDSLIPVIKYLVTGDEGSLNSAKNMSNSTKKSIINLRKNISDLAKKISDFDTNDMIKQLNKLINNINTAISIIKLCIKGIMKLSTVGATLKVVSAISSIPSAVNTAIGAIKRLISWLSRIPGTTIPKISNRPVQTQFEHAKGIINAPFGHFAMVGEQGPELMYVPKGSNIYSNAQSKNLLNNVTPSKMVASTNSQENVNLYGDIVIDAKSVEEFNDVVSVLKGVKHYKNMR